MSDEENARVFGKCNNPNGHGHNYVVEVTVRGPVGGGTGMVMDLNRLSVLIQERLIAPVEHRHLNFDVPFLAGVNPTAENVAVAFWKLLEPALRAHEARDLASRSAVGRRRFFRHECYLGPAAGRGP